MSLGDRLALAGLIVAFLGIAVVYLWPAQKWIGYICLCFAVVLGVLWGLLEIRDRQRPTAAIIVPEAPPKSESKPGPQPEPRPTLPPPLNLHPQFKASSLFTAARKRKITIQINSFHRYLTGIGFKVSTEVPLIGVEPQNVPSFGIGADRLVKNDLSIAANRIDDPNAIVPLYALWVFHKMLPFEGYPDNPKSWFSWDAQLMFERYYTESFENDYHYMLPESDSAPLDKWNNALLDLRKKYGQDFVDRLLYYSLEDWYPAGPTQDLDGFLWTRFDAGLLAIDNKDENRSGVLAVMKARGIPPSK